MDQVYDCIIIGAGYAGLSAARALTAAGKQVLVLEARDRVGGRAWTKHYGDGTYEDYGAAFLGNQHTQMHKLAIQFNIRIFDLFTKGKSILHYRGRARAYSSALTPPLSIWGLVNAHFTLRAFDKICNSVNLDKPWETPNARELDLITAADWCHRNCWSTEVKEMMFAAFELFWGVNSSQISILHAAFYCKSGVSFQHLSTMQDGAQQQIIRGGGQAIADALHRELGDAVRLDEPVVGVDQTGSDHATIKTTKGIFSCRRVIMAIPPPLVPKVEFSPTLPTPKVKLLGNLSMGAFWKIFASYDTPFWRQNGLRGEVVGVDSYVMLVNDVSPEDASRGVLMGFIAGTKALEFLSMSEDQRLAIVMKELEKCYGAAALKPNKVTLHTMMEEKWSTGCPVASPAPGIWTTLGEWLRKPTGRIHWAGTETAEVWNGYMEGAVNSGLRAAREVLGELE